MSEISTNYNNSQKISFDNFDINKKNIRISSPTSLLACKFMGVKSNDLSYLSYDDYIHNNPNFKSLDQSIAIQRYYHYINRRKKLITSLKNIRQELIKDKNDSSVSFINYNTPNNYYNNNIFNKENYKIIKSYIFENVKIFPKVSEDLINQSFDFLINNIYFGKENIENLIKAELSFEKGLIKCSKNFGKKIKEIFFDNYLNNGICNFNNITTKYANFISFVCDKRLDIKKFNDIKFILDDMITQFTLSYNDVFFLFENKFHFLIYYKDDYGDFWELGKPFLKKYMFFFNQDKKIIGYYQIKDNKYTFFPWILISFFSIIIFVLGKYIYKIIFMKHRIKVRELEENFFI